MEVLAATSNIAGLLSLTGQCISGAENLLRFCHEFQDTERQARLLSDAVNGILRCFAGVSALVQTLEEGSFSANCDLLPELGSLRICLEDCEGSFGRWLAVTEKFNRGETNVWRRCMRTLKHSTVEVQVEIARHQQGIETILALVGS